MKKTVILLLCIAIAAGGGYAGYRYYESDKDKNTVIDVVPISMLAEPASNYSWSSGEMDGNISDANAQKIYVDTQKLVQTVFVEEGQSVKKGDVILEYDMTVVELELAQKENQTALIEQNIKMANKELEALRKARPSEEAPVEPDEPYDPYYPDFPEEPDYPEEPEEPVQPIMTVNEVTPGAAVSGGTGTQADPYVINCNLKTVVRKAFAVMTASSGRSYALRVYDDDSQYLYQWLIFPEQLDPAETADWHVTDGLIIDAATGTVSIDPEGKLPAQLSFAIPETPQEMPDAEDFLLAGFQLPGQESAASLQPLTNFMFRGAPVLVQTAAVDNQSLDYMYSRKELAAMVIEKQNEIKQLEIDLKSAQLALKTAQKQQSDGKVVAEMDGIVKKIGKAASEQEEEIPEEEEDPYAEPSADDNAFAIIEGEGGAEVVFRVSEMNLPKVQPGTAMTVMSYENGAFSEAEVTSVEDTPISYSNTNWGDSPNNSTYRVHAQLAYADDFTVGNWVVVQFADSGSSDDGGVVLPIHYVRQEGGDYYIMKQGEDGRLVKQYVRAGRIFYGYYIEITGGLTSDDKICFPYGTDVKEGARTNETTEVIYPSGY